MTEEEKKAAEQAEAEAKAQQEAEFEASLEGLSDEEKAQKRTENEGKNLNNDTETKKALEAERKRREEAERKLDETRQKARERLEAKRKKEEEDDDFDDGEDKPLTRRELQEVLAQNREETLKESRLESAKKLARELSESDDEAELTFEVWRNRTLPGTLTEQISEAHAIANSKKLAATNSELQRSLLNKDRVNRDGSSSQRKPAPAKEPYLNPVEKNVVAGVTLGAA